MSTPMPHPDLAAEQTLRSRVVVVLTGCSYLCVGLAFSYLDRRFGSFAMEATFWLLWALAGFGAGAFYLGRPGNAGSTHWKVQGTFGFVLALFPGFFMFSMLRWVGLALMIIQGARAASLRTRRDFYLSLTLIFVVSLMVATHDNADWTVWFYLGPAWLFAALALAWDHAASAEIPRWAKAGMTLAFILLSFLLACVLFLFVPRPAVLGWKSVV